MRPAALRRRSVGRGGGGDGREVDARVPDTQRGEPGPPRDQQGEAHPRAAPPHQPLGRADRWEPASPGRLQRGGAARGRAGPAVQAAREERRSAGTGGSGVGSGPRGGLRRRGAGDIE